jgi:transcriptional regulator with XRE-family HTH domain
MMKERDEVTLAFAAALKDARRTSGMTQEELAGAAQLNVTHISFLESAKRHPSLGVVMQLEDGLGFKPGTLTRRVQVLLRGNE